jgi:hypothetical protein
MNEQVAKFIESLHLDKEEDIIVFDPYIVSSQDLMDLGIKNLVRIRRPGWGRGNISDYITKIGFEEFKASLEEERVCDDTR